jgi:3'(2'), 5'-bisphosphate nucleotidase
MDCGHGHLSASDGETDDHPRFRPIVERDTVAAGRCSRGRAAASRLDGAPHKYGKPGFLNPDFIARGSS